MRTLIAAALVAAFSFVQAKEVGRIADGNVQVRLFDEQGACPENTVRVELWLDGAKRFEGCAMEYQDKVLILWEDGDRGMVERKRFKPGA